MHEIIKEIASREIDALRGRLIEISMAIHHDGRELALRLCRRPGYP